MRARSIAQPSRRGVALASALVLTICAGARAAETHADATPARPAPRFVVEYLPSLVYRDRESVHLRFRVENPGAAEIECAVSAVLDFSEGEAGGDRDGSPAPVALRVPSDGARSGGLELPSTGWARARCELSWGGARSAALVIRRFGEEDQVPALEARGERLYVKRAKGVTAAPESAVVVLRKRTSVDEREWVMMKLLAEQLSEGTVPAGVTLLGPAFGGRGAKIAAASLPAYQRAARDGAGTWVETVALPGETASGVTHPILADFVAALETLEASRPAELVVWVVACDDARRATPVRTFRKAVDFLIVRARRRSARLAILSVPEPAVPAERRAVYSEELRKAASAFRGIYARVDALEDPACWRPEGESRSRGALMRYPNAKGHAALAEAILDRIGP